MKRREFIALIGGAATGWPFVARAQQGNRMRHIGVLSIEGESGSQSMNPIGPFLQALHDLGWNDGRNIRIDARHFGGDSARAEKLAKELIELNPDVLLARGTLAATALRQYTLSIPIIFVYVPDPVAAGFITNFAHPVNRRHVILGVGSATAAWPMGGARAAANYSGRRIRRVTHIKWKML